MSKQLYGILGIVGIIMLFVVLFVIRYLTIGRIVVTTASSTNYISLFKLEANGSQKIVVDNAQYKISRSLGTGTYVIKVNSKSVAMSKVVRVMAHKTLTYTLNPEASTTLEPVASVSIRNMIVGKDSLMYLGKKDGALYEVDTQNNIRVVDNLHNFTAIKWGNPSYGIGTNSQGDLYTINGSVIEQLQVPFSTTDNKSVLFDVSKDKQIFISHGSDIYSGTDSGGFTKIYTTNTPAPSVVSWGSSVAVLETAGDTSNKNITPSVTILDKSGHVRAKKSLSADIAAGSSDGSLFALSSGSGSRITNDSLTTVAVLPVSNINGFGWVGDTLYYTVGEQLWTYDMSTQTALLVASMPSGSALSNITVSPDSAYIYLTLSSNGRDSQPYRFSVHGQKALAYVYQLPIILPDDSGLCQLDYINFTQPTILAYGSSADPQTCKQSLDSTFSAYDIATSSLQIHYLPQATEAPLGQ